MPAKLQKWFQPRSQIIAGIGDSLGLIKVRKHRQPKCSHIQFQFAELERLTRSQAGTVRQLEATIDECHVSLRAQKTEKEEQAKQIEQLNRQITDMKRQLSEANAQNRALQDQAAAFEQSNLLHQQQQSLYQQQQNERLHQHQSHHHQSHLHQSHQHQGHQHQSHHHQGHQHQGHQNQGQQQLAGPSQGLMFERGPPQSTARPQDYEAPDFEPMGPPPSKRPRPQDPSQG
ncbi:uncharacterized protein LOC62_04G005639 [Vanrija pseudolonga]|uniref:Uncharacterized protein n=1 Tax=Vanrija pseudolonga TaxID=143232 RepID=A0AAF1BIZ5_9TREE|nr:hypothetical protein LOC62_04G005639 [Vanrija pseudolonga]